jgi:hypothetical protein
MLVFGDVETFDMAVGAACSDDRDLAFERHEGFKDRGIGAEILPDLIEIVTLADDCLALAVITEATRLDDSWQTDLLDRCMKLASVRNACVTGRADTQ